MTNIEKIVSLCGGKYMTVKEIASKTGIDRAKVKNCVQGCKYSDAYKLYSKGSYEKKYKIVYAKKSIEVDIPPIFDKFLKLGLLACNH